jgi:hypothetical protein
MDNFALLDASDNKLDGIPKIYYLNYDEHPERREYIETQFKNLNITNYERISTSKYLESNSDKWKNNILDLDGYKLRLNTAGYSISVLEFIKKWLAETDEQSFILIKDITDFEIVKHWPFNWNTLMENIPYDWDCIQLGFENLSIIPFYLHPILPSHTFGPSLINRFYAKKIVKLHCDGENYKLSNYIANMSMGGHSGTIDYFIGHNGKTYSIPLLPSNAKFLGDTTKKSKLISACRNAYYGWWSESGQNVTLSELFTYGKPNDISMIRKVQNYSWWAF